MKTIILFMSFFCLSTLSYGQKQLISYEDLKYLIENNLGKADTFLVSKGYTITQINAKKKTRKYAASLQGGTKSQLELRADGRKVFVELETNDISQYNMIHNSIGAFLVTNTSYGDDIQAYNIKDLGTIYISISDTVPYSPIRKDYDIHLVAEKGITALN
jgi:hypothetical protein